MDPAISIGDKVKNFRKQAGMSQFNLELEIGASTGSISRIENNQINPTKETLLKISEVLDLSFDERVELFGLDYSEIEKYIPEKFLKQKLFKDTTLNGIINSQFYEYAYVLGKNYSIRECDSSLSIPSNEVFYIQNIHNWRNVYSEEQANAQHVPQRIHMRKFAKFLINNSDEGRLFQKRDRELYRESRLLDNSKSNFEYTLMIEDGILTIFLGEPVIKAFTIKNKDIASRARNLFQQMWEENK